MIRKLAVLFTTFLILLEICLQLIHWGLYKRSQELFIPKNGEVRILCIGESTTAGLEKEEDGYPSILEKHLNELFPQAHIRVVNRGLVGAMSSNILSELPGWLDEIHPQIVISMIGINDHFFYTQVLDRSFWSRSVSWLQSLRTYKFFSLLIFQLSHTRPLQDELVQNQSETGEKLRTFRKAGLKQWRLGNLNRAVTEFEAVLQFGNDAPALEGGALDSYLDSTTHLATLYFTTGKPEKAIHVYQVAHAKLPMNPIPAFGLARMYGLTGDSENALRLQQIGDGLLSREVLKATWANYRRIAQRVASSHARLIAMQYPTLDVGQLKATLSSADGIKFVDNRSSFFDAVAKSGYSQIFMDRFAGGFGHMTKRGNELLVENLLSQALLQAIRF